MTTLVMVQTDDDVILGWDSLMTNGNEQTQNVAPKFWVQDGIIYGVSGLVRAGDVIESLDFPTYDGSDPRKWIIRKWAPVYREAVENQASLWNDDKGGMRDFALFMVVGGQAFDVDGVFSPTQNSDGIYTAGSGSDFARGVLNNGGTVMEALSAAAATDAYTGGDLIAKSAKALLDESAAFDGKYRVTVSRADQPHKAWSFELDHAELRKQRLDEEGWLLIGDDVSTPASLLGWTIIHSMDLDADYIAKHHPKTGISVNPPTGTLPVVDVTKPTSGQYVYSGPDTYIYNNRESGLG